MAAVGQPHAVGIGGPDSVPRSVVVEPFGQALRCPPSPRACGEPPLDDQPSCQPRSHLRRLVPHPGRTGGPPSTSRRLTSCGCVGIESSSRGSGAASARPRWGRLLVVVAGAGLHDPGEVVLAADQRPVQTLRLLGGRRQEGSTAAGRCRSVIWLMLLTVAAITLCQAPDRSDVWRRGQEARP